MGLKWFCDLTGKEIFMNPPTEPKPTENIIQYKTMGPNGKLQVHSMLKPKYVKEKAYLLRLAAGFSEIQLSLSEEGMEQLKPEIDALFNKMENILNK